MLTGDEATTRSADDVIVYFTSWKSEGGRTWKRELELDLILCQYFQTHTSVQMCQWRPLGGWRWVSSSVLTWLSKLNQRCVNTKKLQNLTENLQDSDLYSVPQWSGDICLWIHELTANRSWWQMIQLKTPALKPDTETGSFFITVSPTGWYDAADMFLSHY